MSTGEKILIVGPSWVGDMVMSQVLYRLLADTRPGVIIDVLAPGWSEPILARMPEVRKAIKLPIDHGEPALRRRWRLGRALRAARTAQVVVLGAFMMMDLRCLFVREHEFLLEKPHGGSGVGCLHPSPDHQRYAEQLICRSQQPGAA